jgi:CRP/FNR family transcriptional regulator, nitrogen oxide reductase regulator
MDMFKDLTSEQYESILKAGFSEQIPAGAILFYQSDPATYCYLVRKGRLKLYKLNEQGKEVIIRYVGTEEWTGAVTVLKDTTYPVTAEAIEETRILRWDRSTILKIFHQYPDIAIRMIQLLLDRIEEVQNRYQELCTENVERRIARSLLRLMRQAGKKTQEGIFIDMPLGRQGIADFTGTTLYTVSRTLSAWEKNGWIKSGRERITVCNPHALVLFAEETPSRI